MNLRRIAEALVLAGGVAVAAVGPAAAETPVSSPSSSCQGQVTTFLTHEDEYHPFGRNWVGPEIAYYRDPANGSPFRNYGRAVSHNARRDPHPEFGCF